MCWAGEYGGLHTISTQVGNMVGSHHIHPANKYGGLHTIATQVGNMVGSTPSQLKMEISQSPLTDFHVILFLL